jgi:hypothetical protein
MLFVTDVRERNSFVGSCMEQILMGYINYSLELFDELENPKKITREKFPLFLQRCKNQFKIK